LKFFFEIFFGILFLFFYENAQRSGAFGEYV
jgi:hypothetical protein